MTLDEMLLQGPQALVGPSYNVYHYTDQIYKIVHFKSPRLLVDVPSNIDRSRKGGTKKLESAISRARKVVLELALCNKWEWFGTFTLDKNKYDRYNLDSWYKDFSQWLRDQRKKTGADIRYVLVPEMHQDGAWHIHGLLAGLPSVSLFSDLRAQGWRVPNKLVNGGFFCWTQYHAKFGYNSLGVIRSAVGSAFYISEYVGKELSGASIAVGKHLYYASRGLDRSVLHGSVYGDCADLDRYLVNKYEWCETGFTKVHDHCDWSFALEFIDALSPLDPDGYGVPDGPADPQWFDMIEGIQEVLEGFS